MTRPPEKMSVDMDARNFREFFVLARGLGRIYTGSYAGEVCPEILAEEENTTTRMLRHILNRGYVLDLTVGKTALLRSDRPGVFGPESRLTVDSIRQSARCGMPEIGSEDLGFVTILDVCVTLTEQGSIKLCNE